MDIYFSVRERFFLTFLQDHCDGDHCDAWKEVNKERLLQTLNNQGYVRSGDAHNDARILLQRQLPKERRSFKAIYDHYLEIIK